jgi:hypothetical protein
MQAVFRAYRYGQTLPVQVYRLVAMDTVEDYCYRLQVVKASLSANLIQEREINRQYTRAELHHESVTVPLHPIDPLAIADPILNALVRKRASDGQPLVISSHDSAFHDDDETLSEEEKRDAQNEVNKARNAVDRVFKFDDGREFYVKPMEKYYALTLSDTNEPTRVGIVTVASPEHGGIYPPYIPIVASSDAGSILFYLGPTNASQVRFRHVSELPDSWSDPITADCPHLSQETGPHISPKCSYYALRVPLTVFKTRGVYFASARAVYMDNPTLYSEWSDASAPFAVNWVAVC